MIQLNLAAMRKNCDFKLNHVKMSELVCTRSKFYDKSIGEVGVWLTAHFGGRNAEFGRWPGSSVAPMSLARRASSAFQPPKWAVKQTPTSPIDLS